MIRVNQLYKAFDGRPILQGIDLQVPEGQVVCLIGPSGSGKSTLLRCLNRLEEPDRGEIWYRDRLITDPKEPIEPIRAKMGMVFQHFHLFPHLTVTENLCLAPVLLGRLKPQEAQAQAVALLKRVGLEDKAQAYPATLSGGQKQRIAIARTLAMQPETLLFDEPTSALDPEMVGEVLAVIQSLAHEGQTLLIVTHQMNFARSVADRILFLAEGQIVADGTPEEIFEHPTHPRLIEFLAKVKQAD